MTFKGYPEETLDGEEDDGTMPANVNDFKEAVVGHKIKAVVKVGPNPEAKSYWERYNEGVVFILDDGSRVKLNNTDDCCAYTDLEDVILHIDKIDHIITGVGTTDGFTRWHIYADFGDVAELQVGWSCGNPFYYGYGFDISVKEDGDE